jgi:hypothetical protein
MRSVGVLIEVVTVFTDFNDNTLHVQLLEVRVMNEDVIADNKWS